MSAGGCEIGEMLAAGDISWSEEPEGCDGPPTFALIGPAETSLLCGAHARRIVRRGVVLPPDIRLVSLS